MEKGSMQAPVHHQPAASPGFVTTVVPSQQQQAPQIVNQTVVTTNSNNSSSSVPDLPFALALLCLLLNIFFPGVGTIIAGIGALIFRNQERNAASQFIYNVLIGLLQMALSPFLIGWIWSIITGFAILSKSGSTKDNQAIVTVASTTVNQAPLPQPTTVMHMPTTPYYLQPPPQPNPTDYQPSPYDQPPPLKAWN